MTEMWVFGYGSLIWDPGFPVAEAVVARLDGWQRSFCMRSIHHRGSVDQPGLVLALDRLDGGRCDGLALRVQPGAEAATLQGLRERELISSAYIEAELPVTTPDRGITALTFVINPDHPQYCGGLPLESQARIIARAAGGRGANRDYLFATARHLHDLSIADPTLDWLATRVQEIVG